MRNFSPFAGGLSSPGLSGYSLLLSPGLCLEFGGLGPFSRQPYPSADTLKLNARTWDFPPPPFFETPELLSPPPPTMTGLTNSFPIARFPSSSTRRSFEGSKISLTNKLFFPRPSTVQTPGLLEESSSFHRRAFSPPLVQRISDASL